MRACMHAHTHIHKRAHTHGALGTPLACAPQRRQRICLLACPLRRHISLVVPFWRVSMSTWAARRHGRQRQLQRSGRHTLAYAPCLLCCGVARV